MSYTIRTDKTWAATKREMADTFRKWRVSRWEVQSDGAVSASWQQTKEMRAVTVFWTTPAGQEMRLSLDSQPRAVDNFRALYLAIESIRMNETRGVSSGVLRDAYLQLEAPATERDPWEVLGLAPGAETEVVKAVYRTKAKRLHPDTGGDVAGFKALQRAYEAITGEAPSP